MQYSEIYTRSMSYARRNRSVGKLKRSLEEKLAAAHEREEALSAAAGKKEK